MSSVAIGGAASEAGGGGLRPAGEVDGREIVASTAVCRASDPGSCSQTFGIPSLDAYFRVTAQADDGGETVLSRIRESLDVLEPEQVTVPFLPLRGQRAVTTAMEDVGLVVEVERTTCPPNASCLSGVTGTDPAPGAVVPVGSTVTVTVLG